MIYHQVPLRGKHFEIKGEKLVGVSKRKSRERGSALARQEVERFVWKQWVRMLRVAREYTSKHPHVNWPELIVYFSEKKVPLPETLAKKLLAELEKEKKKKGK